MRKADSAKWSQVNTQVAVGATLKACQPSNMLLDRVKRKLSGGVDTEPARGVSEDGPEPKAKATVQGCFPCSVQ